MAGDGPTGRPGSGRQDAHKATVHFVCFCPLVCFGAVSRPRNASPLSPLSPVARRLLREARGFLFPGALHILRIKITGVAGTPEIEDVRHLAHRRFIRKEELVDPVVGYIRIQAFRRPGAGAIPGLGEEQPRGFPPFREMLFANDVKDTGSVAVGATDVRLGGAG